MKKRRFFSLAERGGTPAPHKRAKSVKTFLTGSLTPIYFILRRGIKGSKNDCQDYTTFPRARDNPCGFNGRQQYNDGYVRDVLTRKKTAVLLNFLSK